MKMEVSPPRGSSSLNDPMKSRDAQVPTVKEAGRSIHLIPREASKEGLLAQVHTHRADSSPCQTS